jgi:gliding motility-associated-like protein
LLTLTGEANVANYQAALRSVRYRNDSDDPSIDDRTLNFIVDDGEAPPVTLTGTIITINKPPVITAPALKKAAASGNIALSIDQLVSDPDDNLDLNTLVVTSQAGGLVTIANGIVTVDYSAVPNFHGNDILTITICDIGGRCNTTEIPVEVSAEVFVYTGMSPNGDGVNDYFHIDFLPENTQVAIYNRWGDAVYEESAYDINEPSKRFEGKNKNGTDLVAGSYYYKVKYPDGRMKTGYLLLNR